MKWQWVARADHDRAMGIAAAALGEEAKRHTNALESAHAARREQLQWQEHAGKILADNEQLRREAEHWRSMYEMAVEGIKSERAQLVTHIVELKREGFSPPTVGAAPYEQPIEYPPEIERAIGMRNFDAASSYANREYARQQLQLRPDAANQIAQEILAGDQFDQYPAEELS